MHEFALSAAGGEISEYHLQAAMSACHCRAANYESTDWEQILSLYDRLLQFDGSPVVALNRAVALAEISGPQAGLDAVLAIKDRQALEGYYLYHAALGEFESRLNRPPKAAAHFKKALELARIKSEQAFLQERLSACEPALAPLP
jgi:RNA polymerase sigma-70 factor (ECF subfamily)